MRILLVPTQDYIHHPVPSRHHRIFEILADRHEIHVPHFHVSRGQARPTKLRVHEATLFPVESPAIHYIINAPYHYHVLGQVVRDYDIDVVVNCNVLAGTAVTRAARAAHIPVLFDLADWLPDSAAAYYTGPVLRWLLRESVLRITKSNLTNSDAIVTVSPGLVLKLSRLGYHAGLITNGVDTDVFRPSDDEARAIRQGLGIGADDFVIGFAGSIERWYALHDVMKAFKKLLEYHSRLKLLIVGSSLFTDYMKQLTMLARSLKIDDKVILTGAVPYCELPSYINAMDVCLIPLAPKEWVNIALPNKFFEYSACCRPILSTRIPDVMEIGGPQLFVYDDYDDFVEVVKGLIEHPQKFKVDCDGYSWKHRAEEFEKVLSGLVET